MTPTASEWKCPLCYVVLSTTSPVTYIEHQCEGGQIQSMDARFPPKDAGRMSRHGQEELADWALRVITKADAANSRS